MAQVKSSGNWYKQIRQPQIKLKHAQGRLTIHEVHLINLIQYYIRFTCTKICEGMHESVIIQEWRVLWMCVFAISGEGNNDEMNL
jgi:hypothetical protein